MLYSYNWLSKYFGQKLPSPLEVEEGIIFHSFEVEGIEEKNGDSLLEIKVLPDRAHDCLCHEGVAREIGAIFNLAFTETTPGSVNVGATNRKLEIKIEDPKLCRRYVGRVIENVKVGESPAWLKEKLEVLGQRSINNVVDSANYAMLDIGQPMHAFDADKVVGNICIRHAKDGEHLTTLDGKEVDLDPSILLIADDEGPLVIAGIKGGKRAEVDANTKNLILESANFDPVSIRRTSTKIDIRTDASKRYENELTPELADRAMDLLTDLIVQSSGEGLVVGEKIDVYPTKAVEREIIVSPARLNAILGVEVPEAEMIAILERLGLGVEKSGEELKLVIPSRRVDLEVEENIAEEIGRIYGYDKVENRLLGTAIERTEDAPAVKKFKTSNKIREILVNAGFSEVYGYALVDKGAVELANPLASDKSFLRTNLSDFILDRLLFNLQNVLFDAEAVKIFEIGRAFPSVAEETRLCVGVGYKKQKKVKEENVKEELVRVGQELLSALGLDNFGWAVNFVSKNIFNQEYLLAVVEVNFDELAGKIMKSPEANLDPFISPAKAYKKVSAYPRVIRDIALFVPEGTQPEEVAEVIRQNASELLAEGPIKFDEYHKEGKVSYAFRSVFQSYERTLSDEEINTIWQRVEKEIKAKGWEVR